MKELVIISGKGGTGKTSLTAGLAALWGQSVIADCDVDAADLFLLLQPKIKNKSDFFSGIQPAIDPAACTRCGSCVEVCEFNAITGDYIIDTTTCEGCGVCYHFCPSGTIKLTDRLCGEWYQSDTRFGPMVHARLGIAEENSGKLVTLIKKQARDTAKKSGIETILVDGSPGIGCPVISSISGAALVLVVTEPTVSGLHDMKRVLGLAAHFQIPSAVVINKHDINPEMTTAITNEIEKNRIPLIGKIPYDEAVTQAMIQGKTVVETSNNMVTTEMRNIRKNILDIS